MTTPDRPEISERQRAALWAARTAWLFDVDFWQVPPTSERAGWRYASEIFDLSAAEWLELDRLGLVHYKPTNAASFADTSHVRYLAGAIDRV